MSTVRLKFSDTKTESVMLVKQKKTRALIKRLAQADMCLVVLIDIKHVSYNCSSKIIAQYIAYIN